MLQQRLLHQPRRNLLAPAIDELAPSAHQPQHARLVQRADIARVQPAIVQGPRGRRGVVQIADHHAGALDQHLAWLTRDCIPALVVDQPEATPRAVPTLPGTRTPGGGSLMVTWLAASEMP